MKEYIIGKWGLTFIFSLEGSVFPKALACAIPNAVIAVALWYLLRSGIGQETLDIGISAVTASQAWNTYNWVIGFLVSYRAQRAYSRWWEGGTLLQQARGEWFNAYSSLIAFCSHKPEKLLLVQKFQKTIARLTSMLYGSALMAIATQDDFDFEIIDATGLSEEHVSYLRTQKDKCEIIMQWIQRLIVDNMENGVLPIPPPVLSRVFQELSRGIVNIHNVRKITEFQFPFPAAQMVVTMLIVQWAMTPVMAALIMDEPVWVFFGAFFPVFACWGINYTAQEIEQPFGDDFNDLPLHLMQGSLNNSILALLDTLAQRPPDFNLDEESTQEASAFGVKASVKEYHASRDYNFSRMRSVRFVTLQNPGQLKKIRRQFSATGPEMRQYKRRTRAFNNALTGESPMTFDAEADFESYINDQLSSGNERRHSLESTASAIGTAILHRLSSSSQREQPTDSRSSEGFANPSLSQPRHSKNISIIPKDPLFRRDSALSTVSEGCMRATPEGRMSVASQQDLQQSQVSQQFSPESEGAAQREHLSASRNSCFSVTPERSLIDHHHELQSTDGHLPVTASRIRNKPVFEPVAMLQTSAICNQAPPQFGQEMLPTSEICKDTPP